MKQILVDKDSIYNLHTYFNQMLLFFQSSPFLFQLEPIAWFYIDNIPNAPTNSGPMELFWNWLGPVTSKQSMS